MSGRGHASLEGVEFTEDPASWYPVREKGQDEQNGCESDRRSERYLGVEGVETDDGVAGDGGWGHVIPHPFRTRNHVTIS